jgi:hypothetical protein
MIEMQKGRKVVIALVVLLLFLSLVASVFLSKNGVGSGGETGVLGQEAPLSVDWSIAVVSSDSGFVEGVRSAFVARDFSVVPVSRAWEAVGKDLVIVGWDALGELSRDPGLVIALVNGSRLLAVAEPGVDALRILFSGIVKPVKLGEKDEPSDPFAFLPMVEENGYLYPGCVQNMVLVKAIPTKGGKLAMEYTVTTLKAKSDLPKTLPLLVKKSLEKQQQQPQTRLENRAGIWRPMLYVSPTWVYIGSYYSELITLSGSSGLTAGETNFGVVAGWGQDTYDPTYGTYLWEIMLYYHGERGLNGYSPPVKIAGLWNIEPNVAILDARTDTYSDQRVAYISPTGSGNNGQITITFSYPPGLSFTQNINPQVTWETNYNSYYSAKYGGYVMWQAIWKWGLTSYSSNQYYAMAGLVWMESVNPLFFKVIIKANAYLATRGIADIASSGEQVFYFRADTSTLQRTG